jgi:hypothetical protein
VLLAQQAQQDQQEHPVLVALQAQLDLLVFKEPPVLVQLVLLVLMDYRVGLAIMVRLVLLAQQALVLPEQQACKGHLVQMAQQVRLE